MKIKGIPADAKQKAEDIIEEFNQKNSAKATASIALDSKGNIFILTGVIMEI